MSEPRYDVRILDVSPGDASELLVRLPQLTEQLGLGSLAIEAKQRREAAEQKFNPEWVSYVPGQNGRPVAIIRNASLRRFAKERRRGSSQLGTMLGHYLVTYQHKGAELDKYLVTDEDGRHFLSAERAPALDTELRLGEIRPPFVGTKMIELFHEFCQQIYLPTAE